MKTYNILSSWIRHLILDKPLPLHMVNQDNFLEDGMNLQQYWDYECHNFQQLSAIFNLDEHFSLELLHEIPFHHAMDNQNNPVYKKQIYFYIINNQKKVVCKMSMTLDSNGLITGNDFHAQIVPKFIIRNHQIDGLGLAIHARNHHLTHIISHYFNLDYLTQGSNYHDDGFYVAQFSHDDSDIWENMPNHVQTFHLSLRNSTGRNNQRILEKRTIFLDNFRPELQPYFINQKTQCIESVDDNYPVHFNLYYEKNEHVNNTNNTNNSHAHENYCESINYPYPRNLKASLHGLKKAIITDCLDNDWHIEF
jgi:hypothetical protein